MSFHYEHPPYAQFADEGQPRFWRRRYGGIDQAPMQVRGMVVVSLAPAEAIWIYGFSFVSAYPEDRQQERWAWRERRSFMAYCYSVMEPRGEPGMVPLAAVEEITREEFEAAAARDWREDATAD